MKEMIINTDKGNIKSFHRLINYIKILTVYSSHWLQNVTPMYFVWINLRFSLI